MTINEEIRSDQTVLIGAFTEDPPTPRTDQEAEDMVFPPADARGREPLAGYLRALRPQVTAVVDIPHLGPEGRIETRPLELSVPIGGALIGTAPVEADEQPGALLASFDADAVACNALTREGDRPLLKVAVQTAVAGQMLDPDGPFAAVLQAPDAAGRLALLDVALADNARATPIPGGREMTLPALTHEGDAPAFPPAEFPGVSAPVTKRQMRDLRVEAARALLAVAPVDRPAAFLREVKAGLEAGLAEALGAIAARQAPLQSNWVALALAHGASPAAAAPRVLNVPAGWMTGPAVRLPAPGGVGSGRIAQEHAFEAAVVSLKHTDMSKAAIFAVLLDPVETPAELERLGEWAHRNFVTLIANAAADDPDALARTMKTADYRKTAAPWKQNVHFVAGSFAMDRPVGARLAVPVAAVVAARQIALANAPAGNATPATGIAVPVSGQQVLLLDQSWGGRTTATLRKHRVAPTLVFRRRDDEEIYGANMVNIVFVGDGGFGVYMSGAKSQYEADEDRPAELPFQFIAAVNVRNFIVRSIARYIQKHYQGVAVAQQKIQQLERELNGFLASCAAGVSGSRRLIGRGSRATVALQANGQIDVNLMLSFIPIADSVRIAALAVVEEITMEQVGDTWVVKERHVTSEPVVAVT